MRIQNLILCFLIVLSISEKTNKKKSKKHHKIKNDSKDEIETLFNWAKKNNIYILIFEIWIKAFQKNETSHS